jgi:hypothetical protein
VDPFPQHKLHLANYGYAGSFPDAVLGATKKEEARQARRSSRGSPGLTMSGKRVGFCPSRPCRVPRRG